VSAKVIPLRKLEPANAAPSRPWIRGEVFSRDGVDYELVTVGEIQSVEPCSLQPVLRQNLIRLSGRRPMLSREAKERLGD
jgi:hypothetical protein